MSQATAKHQIFNNNDHTQPQHLPHLILAYTNTKVVPTPKPKAPPLAHMEGKDFQPSRIIQPNQDGNAPSPNN